MSAPALDLTRGGVRKPTVMDLFSGIGGFSLGLERAGFQTIAFCEIEPFCRRVLAKHWPSIPCHDDVTTREFQEGEADVVCGGFPCQDLSAAGKRAGLTGKRSGLYRELVRAIRLVRPKFAIMENVAALLGRGMGVVLGDLAEIGYDTEWHCLSASAIGAPHRRDRVWIVANPDSGRMLRLDPDARNGGQIQGERLKREFCGSDSSQGSMADASCAEWGPQRSSCDGLAVGQDGLPQRQEGPGRFGGGSETLADAERSRLSGGNVERAKSPAIIPAAFRRYRGGSEFGEAWRVEPDVGRVADGIPERVDRLSGLGNAVVPQIPELIGRAILASEAA